MNKYFLTRRATELDPEWVKGHIRRAQVLVAQDRLEDAMLTYDHTITLCKDVKERKNCESQKQQVMKKINSSGTPDTVVSKDVLQDWMFTRMEKDIPDPSKFLTLCPSPLGYLTAADKIYRAYNLMETITDIDTFSGKRGWRFFQNYKLKTRFTFERQDAFLSHWSVLL